METPFDMQRLQALLDAHGSVPSRWPVDARAAAQSLLGHSAEARAALHAQQRLEATLDKDIAPGPSPTLHAAILARAPRPPRRSAGVALRDLWSALGGLRIAGPAFAAALIFGISIGTTALAASGEGEGEDDLLELAQLSDDSLDY